MRQEDGSLVFETSRYGSAVSPPKGSVPLFAGLPPAVEFDAFWTRRTWNPGVPADRLTLLADPNTPAVGSGTEWVSTAVGNGATLTLSAATFPPYLRIATASTADGDGAQFQQTLPGPQFSFITGVPSREAYLGGVFRLSDLTQSELFFGFAATDTSILAGVDDFVGFYKPDDSTVLQFISSGTSVAPASAPGATNLIDLALADALGGPLTSDWFLLFLQVSGNQVHAFFQAERAIGAQRGTQRHNIPAHVGTFTLPTMGGAVVPSLAFVTGTTAAKNLDISRLFAGSRFALGGDAR